MCKKISIIILTLILCLSATLVGCNSVLSDSKPICAIQPIDTDTFDAEQDTPDANMSTSNPSSEDLTGDIAEENNSQDIPEGGGYGRICATYLFATYKDFQEFYSVFVNYNSERYIVPNDNTMFFKLHYRFDSNGMKYADYKTGRYDFKFQSQVMNVNIVYMSEDVGYFITGRCLPIDETQPLGEIKYTLQKKTNGYSLEIYSGEQLIYVGKLSNNANPEAIDRLTQHILKLFTMEE